MTTSLFRAQRILGEKRVITKEQNLSFWKGEIVWGTETPGDLVLYPEETLWQCAEENSHGALWSLYYYSGQSLYKLDKKAIKGFNYPQGEWGWQSIVPLAPGYYLINFFKSFPGISWEDQEEELNKLTLNQAEIVRANSTILAEAIVTFEFVHEQKLVRGWRSWGSEVVDSDNLVIVGIDPKPGPWDIVYGLSIVDAIPRFPSTETLGELAVATMILPDLVK
ncbi:MAG: hypothetical protein WCW02_03190 [Candidatus Buchananbacteria bacterium]